MSHDDGLGIFQGVDMQKSHDISRCPTISATLDVAGVFEEMVLLKDQVWVAGALDSNFRLLCWNIVGEGSRPGIRPIDVFAGAIIHSGTGTFLVRNSPPESPTSEDFDRALLRRLLSTGALLGHTLLDFVVLERTCCRSLFVPKHVRNTARRQRSMAGNRISHHRVNSSARPPFEARH